MSDARIYTGRERLVILTTLTAVAKYTAVKAAATQGQVTVAGDGDKIVGVLAEAYDAASAARQVRIIEAIPGTVIPMIASGDINRQTSSKQTRIVADADGEVKALPTAAGTYNVLGRVDLDSPASTTDAGGDIIGVLVEPDLVQIQSLDAHIALTFHVSDATAGVTSTKFGSYKLPTGVSATVVDVQSTARNVGAAGATIDVKEGATSILSAPIAVTGGGAQDAGTVSDTAIAAGATLNFYYTTGASTGSLVDGSVTVLLKLAAA